MRRLTASLFLIFYLLGGTALHELVKLSAFVSHFQEHRAEDPGMSLLEFIRIHYFNGSVVDADYARDMELPFKTVDSGLFSASHLLPHPAALNLGLNLPNPNASLPLYDPPAIPAAHLSDIWQPPKTC